MIVAALVGPSFDGSSKLVLGPGLRCDLDRGSVGLVVLKESLGWVW